MNGLRVLMVNKFLYPRGGAEIYMLELARELEARGAECRFFAMQDSRNLPSPSAQLFPAHVDFEHPSGARQPLRAGMRMLYSTSARRGMARLLSAERPDVAHLHNIYHQLSPSVLAPMRDRGLPVVMTVHDYKLVCPVYTLLSGGRVCTRCVGGAYRHAIVQRCHKGSISGSVMVAAESRIHRTLRLYLDGIDAYIAPSRYLERKLIEGGYPADRIHVIPNFAATTGLPAAPMGDAILYAGRLAAAKGLDVLLEAAAGSDLELRIAGDGPERARLERLACDRRVRATFLGHLDREQLELELRRARAVVLPSVWPENCPLGLIEAMAQGRPTIASDIGGIPELVEHGVTGLLVPDRDPRALREAMLELARDAPRALALGEAGRQRFAADLSADVHVSRVAAVYRRVLDAAEGRDAA